MGAAIPLLIGTTIATTGFSAYNQIKAGKAQQTASRAQADADIRASLATKRAAESQARLAEYNAGVSDILAKDAVDRGEEEAQQIGKEVERVVGSQRAGFAANNIDVGFGTAVDLAADTAWTGELDALQARTNAMREAWGYQVEATDLRTRAGIVRQEGANAVEVGRANAAASLAAGKTANTLGKLGAANSILGGASSLLMARYGYRWRG